MNRAGCERKRLWQFDIIFSNYTEGTSENHEQPVPNGLVEAGIGQTTLMLQTVYQVVTNRSRRRRQWKVGFSRYWSVALGREVHGATVRSEVAWKCKCSCCRASTITEVRVAHCWESISSTICLLISKGYTKLNQLEYLGVDGRIILRWIYRKWDGGQRLD
jgi:hypothetical protein